MGEARESQVISPQRIRIARNPREENPQGEFDKNDILPMLKVVDKST